MSLLEDVATSRFAMDYGNDLEQEITNLSREIGYHDTLCNTYPARWLAIKLLEQDQEIQQSLLAVEGGPAVLTHAQITLSRLNGSYGTDVDTRTICSGLTACPPNAIHHDKHRT